MVAQSKQLINIKDAYQDPRFNSAIDLRTGYKTNIILSMPICNYEGEVIGVAQIINKTNDTNEFTPHDVEVFQRYLTFCGIGIQNAQLFEMSVLEFRRNQILLNLARSIFEEQNNLECLVTKIMTEARELLKCERCAVFLLDTECCEAVSELFVRLLMRRVTLDKECCEAVSEHFVRLLMRRVTLDKECCEAWRVVVVAVTSNVYTVPHCSTPNFPLSKPMLINWCLPTDLEKQKLGAHQTFSKETQ
uniref:GAF domain-containing protein n=1 Tax=Timema monikensis TaxID=170555 RepID=A0A7R9E006_9NEOP|nr:unnamed protein product [Timema monikensis]